MRTIHQADAKAQLLVRVAAPELPASGGTASGNISGDIPGAAAEDDGSGDETAALDAVLQGGAADSDLKASKCRVLGRARLQQVHLNKQALAVRVWHT